MSERSRNREIVESMTRDVKEHFAKLGKPISSEAAHRMVADMARTRDRQRAAGDTKNKRKGAESGRRREKEERERIAAAADRRRTQEKVAKGGTPFSYIKLD